jgi:hypothetical protein
MYFYVENNVLLFITNYGIAKFKISNSCDIHKTSNVIYIRKTYFSLLHKYLNTIFYSIKLIANYIKNLIISFFIKYKVIGLGHKILYSKGVYLFKLGYSHLIYCFIPLQHGGVKKKKRKLFNKLFSINKISLNNLFFILNKLRIPDIFSMNGIFNRALYMFFKKGKKSFLL